MMYQNKRTPYGKIMFNITLKASTILINHIWLYYLLNYTWGLIMTIVGWIALGFIKLFLRKNISEFDKFGLCYYIKFGNRWGGLSLGTNFFVANNMGDEWTLHTKCHELGHTFQNAIWGPLAIFLIYIPSYIRYWKFRSNNKKNKPNPDYDLFWAEGNATTIGEKYYYKKDEIKK